jgi:uridylate kinase
MIHYRRILLKLSGEVLGGGQTGADKPRVDPGVVSVIAQDIAAAVDYGVQVGIVVGGGNWFRGVEGAALGISRVTADRMGMLATLMNSLLMQEALVNKKLEVRVLSAVSIAHVMEPFECLRAKHYLDSGKVVIFAGGTGHPFVSTDSAASLRALEVGADILLKATTVDGIYNADPLKDPQAKLYTQISYDDVIHYALKVMDLTAFMQCREHRLPIRVFNINKPHSLTHLIEGQAIGTLVSEADTI